MAAPEGSSALDDAWSKNITPSAAQYAAAFDSPSEQYAAQNNLHQNHLTAIAHRSFKAPNGSIADIILMSFASDNEAASRYYNLVYSLTAATGGPATDLDGFNADQAQVAHATAPDAGGLIYTRAVAHKPGSRITIQFDLYCDQIYDPADLLAWLTRQYSLTG